MTAKKKKVHHPDGGAEAPAWWLGLLPLAIVVAGLAVYANSFSGVMLFNDQVQIVENPHLHHLSPLNDVLVGRQPVVNLTLALNYALGGLDVWGYHAVNLAFHILAGLTLYGLIRRTLCRQGTGQCYRDAAPFMALATALIWVVHPLGTQSVTYIVQRSESLMGLLYFVALYCAVRSADAAKPGRWQFCAILACALGMGTNAAMVTAPAAILLFDRIFLADSLRSLVRQRWGIYVALAATWAVLFLVRGLGSSGYPDVGVGLDYKDVGSVDYLLTQPGVILSYLRLALVPVGLCIDHGRSAATGVGGIVVPGIALLGLLMLTVWAVVRRPRLGFVAAGFFLLLAPRSSLLPLQDLMLEPRMYLPLAPVVLLAVLGAYELLHLLLGRTAPAGRRSSYAGLVLAGLVVVVLGAGTTARNRVYHSAIEMWSDVVEKYPDNARGHVDLGLSLTEAGRIAEAVAAFHRAIEIEPTNARAHNGLGVTIARQGDLDTAGRSFEEAIRLRPTFADPYLNLGKALAESRAPEKAIEYYRDALLRRPGSAKAHLGMGEAYFQQNKHEEAATEFREAVRLDPLSAQAYGNLGTVLLVAGQPFEAADPLERAVALNGGTAAVHNSLGIIYVRQRRATEAVTAFRRAIAVDPSFAQGHFNLGNTLAQAGQLEEAKAAYRRTLQVRPDHVAAQRALAILENETSAP